MTVLVVKHLYNQEVPGNRRVTQTEFTFPSSSTEGGEPVTAAQLGLKKVAWANCFILNGSESEEWVGFVSYAASTALLKPWSVKTGKVVAAEKDMSKLVCRVEAVGY